MAISNYKEMLTSVPGIKSEFSSFFKTWKTMRKINKIKKSHDFSWYEKYLLATKKLRKIILHYEKNSVSIFPVSEFQEFDSDMIDLYLSEIFVSHSISCKIVDQNYEFVLTDKYIYQE